MLGYFDADGKAVIKDMFTPGYIPPTPDASQDIEEASLKRENGVNVLKFRKKISSGDDKARIIAVRIDILSSNLL